MKSNKNGYLTLGIAFFVCSTPILGQDSSSEQAEIEIGEFYVDETHQDWQKLCQKKPAQDDPCHMYQLIRTENNHPTAEISLFRIEDQEGISAAGTILTPHKTLLSSNLVLTVDKDNPWDYPFSWCDKRGCYVRVAFTDDDIFSMKKRRSGTIKIVSISAPDQPVILPISFLGFTAAFGALQK